jgi:hypothetical protein
MSAYELTHSEFGTKFDIPMLAALDNKHELSRFISEYMDFIIRYQEYSLVISDTLTAYEYDLINYFVGKEVSKYIETEEIKFINNDKKNATRLNDLLKKMVVGADYTGGTVIFYFLKIEEYLLHNRLDKYAQ